MRRSRTPEPRLGGLVPLLHGHARQRKRGDRRVRSSRSTSSSSLAARWGLRPRPSRRPRGHPSCTSDRRRFHACGSAVSCFSSACAAFIGCGSHATPASVSRGVSGSPTTSSKSKDQAFAAQRPLALSADANVPRDSISGGLSGQRRTWNDSCLGCRQAGGELHAGPDPPDTASFSRPRPRRTSTTRTWAGTRAVPAESVAVTAAPSPDRDSRGRGPAPTSGEAAGRGSVAQDLDGPASVVRFQDERTTSKRQTGAGSRV
jgi:hypothetical protein